MTEQSHHTMLLYETTLALIDGARQVSVLFLLSLLIDH
jgi:hypothetical protein